MRNSRVFEFAGIVGLAKLLEFQRNKVRIIRNGQSYVGEEEEEGKYKNGQQTSER